MAGLIASGGDLKAGIIGAATGGALGIGDTVTKIAVSSIVGGIGAEIQGGSFLAGALSGGVSAGIGSTGFFAGDFDVGKLLVSATVSGFVSKLGGGKFGNGALMGAFAYAIGHGVKEFMGNNEVGFRTEKAAARAALRKAFQVSQDSGNEYGGLIYRQGERYFHTDAIPGTPTSVKVYSAILPDSVTMDSVTAFYHTHVDASGLSRVMNKALEININRDISPSGELTINPTAKLVNEGLVGDIPLAQDNGHNAYLANSLGQFQRLNVKTNAVERFGDLFSDE